MMKKQWCCFLSLLLCISLIFIGCEKDIEEKPLAETSSETEFSETNAMDEHESAEKQTATEPIQSEESNSANGVQVEGCLPWHPCKDLGNYQGVVVRWGSVVGGSAHPDFFPKVEASDVLFDLVMVNVEILDLLESEWLYVADKIRAMEALYLPPTALEQVVEGEEALVFIYTDYRYSNGDDWAVAGYIDSPASAYLNPQPVPIFRYEEGRMIVDESQMVTSSSSGEYRMFFLRDVYRVNKKFQELGVDEKYHFRNGMTMEELEAFYYRAWLNDWR